LYQIPHVVEQFEDVKHVWVDPPMHYRKEMQRISKSFVEKRMEKDGSMLSCGGFHTNVCAIIGFVLGILKRHEAIQMKMVEIFPELSRWSLGLRAGKWRRI